MLRIIGLAGSITVPAAARSVGSYVLRYDPEFANGRGDMVSTDDPTKAARFADPGAALECWRTIPRSMTTRPDGKPNRPLCAFTVDVVRRSEAIAGNVTPVVTPRGL